MRHRDVGNAHRPVLVGWRHSQLSQQIWKGRVARRRFRRVGPAIQGLDAHPLHACGHVQPSGGEALLARKTLHNPTACKGIVLVQLVDPAHELEVVFADRAWFAINAVPADPEQTCLTGKAQLF